MIKQIDVMMCMPEGGQNVDAVTRAYQTLYARNTDTQAYQVIHYFVLPDSMKPSDESDKTVTLTKMGAAVSALADVDAIYMCHGWEKSYWCLKIHRIAQACGVKVMEEDFA